MTLVERKGVAREIGQVHDTIMTEGRKINSESLLKKVLLVSTFFKALKSLEWQDWDNRISYFISFSKLSLTQNNST